VGDLQFLLRVGDQATVELRAGVEELGRYLPRIGADNIRRALEALGAGECKSATCEGTQDCATDRIIRPEGAD
jgi:hypothetical protein